MQAELDDAVEVYGDKPFDIEELARTILDNLPELHLFVPIFWPLLFWETEKHNAENPSVQIAKSAFAEHAQTILDHVAAREADSRPTFGSLLKTLAKKPSILSLYTPGLGLLNMARGWL